MQYFKNFQRLHGIIFVLLVSLFVSIPGITQTLEQKNVFAEKGFIHILGPNPAIITGEKGTWDDWNIESADIVKYKNTYYWFYHGRSIIERDNILNGYETGETEFPSGYRLGVATSESPLGPWTRYENNPILDYGPLDSWDGWGNACATILKAREGDEDSEKYYMFYNGWGRTADGERTRGIGLATASHPLGPWKRYENNPILDWKHGWLCSVFEVDGKLFMYHGGNGVAFSLATADKPEGPWQKYKNNPLISRGDWGDWDDGGHSEAKVLYREGIFHMFYAGSPYPPQSFESIGYAYSFDGYNWIEYSGNPVVPRERTPDASAFGEIMSLLEPPYIYLYYTLRYNSKDFWEAPHGEDLGIHILTIDPHYSLSMPILNITSLSAGKSSDLEECCPLSFEAVGGLALTVECKYNPRAKAGLKIHIVSSYDGLTYNNVDLYSFDIDLKAGQTVNKTIELTPKVKFIKIVAENTDITQSVEAINVTATLGN